MINTKNALSFPNSELYRSLTPKMAALHESAAPFGDFHYTERHLHCVWADAAIRPPILQTASGEVVAVEHPGQWNLEAGPDFIQAILLIGPEKRRMSGDVEIHIRPGDWRAHGHSNDPRYSDVRFHVTYYPGTGASRLLPQGALHIPLQDALRSNPGFCFAAIDVGKYPYGEPAAKTPCGNLLSTWCEQDKERLLTAAGEERLRRKSERLASRMREQDDEQVLYEEFMSALGYKHNKIPFRRLANVLPLEKLRNEASRDPFIAYAMLLGVSGLLPERECDDWDDETLNFFRVIWDTWWKCAGAFDGRCLRRDEWQLDHLMPVNHPVRRLMAAARGFTRTPSLAGELRNMISNNKTFIRKAMNMLGEIEDPFWSHHHTWSSSRQKERIALIGCARAASIVTNVFIPFLAAQGVSENLHSVLLLLPAEADNSVLRHAAHTLFGSDQASSLYRKGIRQQGLIQIFQDYCISNRSLCAECAFPEILSGYIQ